MANSGGEDEDCGEWSGDEEEREQGDDDLIEVEPSGTRDSVKPLLRLPERNEEDTAWTEHTLLPFVSENHAIGIFEQLLHGRTSFQVKSFTFWHDHPSLHILVMGWSDG